MTKLRLLLTVFAALAVGAIVFLLGPLSNDFLGRTNVTSLSSEQGQNFDSIAAVENVQLDGKFLQISGGNASNASVLIRLGDEVLAEPTTGQSGQWQVRLDLSQRVFARTTDAVMTINIVTRLADGRTVSSDQAITVIRRVEGNQQESPNAAEAEAAPESVMIIKTEPGKPTRIIESGFAKTNGGALTLQAVDYDNAGGVIINGKLVGNGRIRVFANQVILGETGLDEFGGWQLVSTTTLPVGRYMLRLVAFNPEAEIIGEIRVPFERYAPEAMTDKVNAVRVKYDPSNWHISRALFGGGQQHTVIYNGDLYGDNAKAASP